MARRTHAISGRLSLLPSLAHHTRRRRQALLRTQRSAHDASRAQQHLNHRSRRPPRYPVAQFIIIIKREVLLDCHGLY